MPATGEENSVHGEKERGRGRRRGWDELSLFEDFPSMMGEKNMGYMFPLQDPTSPEAGDLRSHLVQYRREVKVVRQQSKNEEASDYNLLKTVLRFCLISIHPFSSVHSIFSSYSHFSFTDVFAGHGVS